jgi:hypothetical protein
MRSKYTGLLPGGIAEDTLAIDVARSAETLWPFTTDQGAYRLELFIRDDRGIPLTFEDRVSNGFSWSAK